MRACTIVVSGNGVSLPIQITDDETGVVLDSGTVETQTVTFKVFYDETKCLPEIKAALALKHE